MILTRSASGAMDFSLPIAIGKIGDLCVSSYQYL